MEIAFLLLLLVCAVPLVVLVIEWYRSSGVSRGRCGPRCGNCSYDLTGCPSNRCPECGMLFVEAGVRMGQGQVDQRRRRAVVTIASVALLLALLLLAGFGISIFQARRATQQLAAAVAAHQAAAAQQAAVTKFLNDQLNAVGPTSRASLP